MASDTSRDDMHAGPVRHASAALWCAVRAEPAVVNVIERGDAGGRIRYVLWCSLRGCDHCSEACLHAPLSRR